MEILIFSIVAVGLFVLGLSLTLIFKGHHIDGEISTNKNMQALGITCAIHSGGNGHNDRNADGGSGAKNGSTADSLGSGLGSARDCPDLCTSCAGPCAN